MTTKKNLTAKQSKAKANAKQDAMQNAKPKGEHYWLVKSEPTSYSIDDLKRDKMTQWDGVRNYQARNFMQDMRKGDRILFYHSSCDAVGVYGIARVEKEAYPDATAWDAKNSHSDKKSTKEKPLWFMVDIAFIKKFTKPVLLDELKADSFFNTMRLTQKGSRLSVQPVEEKHFEKILKLAK